MEKQIEVVAALLWQGDRFLLCQRPVQKKRGMQWEFVGGKVEPGETNQQALIRECREELDITICVEQEFMQLIHSYPDITVHVTLFHSLIAEGTLQKLEHVDFRWVTPEQAVQFDICPADRAFVEKIREVYACDSEPGPRPDSSGAEI